MNITSIAINLLDDASFMYLRQCGECEPSHNGPEILQKNATAKPSVHGLLTASPARRTRLTSIGMLLVPICRSGDCDQGLNELE
jgi:hypothetical protein